MTAKLVRAQSADSRNATVTAGRHWTFAGFPRQSSRAQRLSRTVRPRRSRTVLRCSRSRSSTWLAVPELDHRISAALSPPAAPRQPRCRIMRHLSAGQAAGEPACRPGSVHPLARAGGHPSGTAVAGSLLRSTREHRAGRPLALAQETRPEGRIPLLTLLRVGFT